MTDVATYERATVEAIDGMTEYGGGQDGYQGGSVLALPVVTAASALMRTHQVRSDALPEHIEYRDEGCDLFASCLTCPLPRCRYDEPGGVRAMMNRERDHQIRALREDPTLSVDDIADRFGVSRRTVFRALEGHVTRYGARPDTGGAGKRSA